MKINTETSHPSVFISSTFVDLKEERKAVAEILRKLDFRINALDIAPAADDDSKSEILQGIKESDFIILLVGERYGSIVTEMSSRNSVTHWEYLQAKSRQKSVLVYFIKKDSNDPLNTDDGTEPQRIKKKEALDRFKKLLSENHNPKYVDGVDDLKQEIENAIVPTYRKGLKKLLKKNAALTKERDELVIKNEELLHMITSLSESLDSANNHNIDISKPRGLRALQAGSSQAITPVSTSGIAGIRGLNPEPTSEIAGERALYTSNLLGGLFGRENKDK